MSVNLQESDERERHSCEEFLETRNIYDVDKNQYSLMIHCKGCGTTIISPLKSGWKKSTHKNTHVSPTFS